MKTRKIVGMVFIASSLLLLNAAVAQVKVGFTGVFSGPQALVGQDQYDGFMLALEQLNGSFGGQKVAVFKEDDQAKPEIGLQGIRKLLGNDKVDAIVGLGFGNVSEATRKLLTTAGVPAIATNGLTTTFAGAACAPNLFSASWQTDGPSEAMGKYAKDQGFKRVYLLAPNYSSGKLMLDAFKRVYGGEGIDERYSQLGQMDYSAEITQIRAAAPDAIFVFLPGAMGINFVKQLDQANISKEIPLLSVFTVDATTLPAIGKAAVGSTYATMWDPSLNSKLNREFVSSFKEKYKREPSAFAASGFDAAQILNIAIAESAGTTSDKQAFATAVKKAGSSFKSIRGTFSFNNNNMPIQNYYIVQVVNDGEKVMTKLVDIALEKHSDIYHSQCPLS